MSTPIESRHQLYETLKEKGEMSFEEVREFQVRPDTNFGPGIDIVDILIAISNLGKIHIDYKNQKVISR